MSVKIKRILYLLGFLLANTCVTVGWLVFFSDWPGGMRPTYQATDYDSRLTQEAKTATVVIEVLNQFHHDHSGFPSDSAALAPYLSSGLWTSNAPEIAGWYYTRSADGLGYRLTRKLGWDPVLRYVFDGSKSNWVFVPGDGSPEKSILLKP